MADIKAATTVGTKERHIFGEDVMLVWVQINMKGESRRTPYLYVLNTVIYLREFSPPEIPDMPTILANGQLPCEVRSIGNLT